MWTGEVNNLTGKAICMAFLKIAKTQVYGVNCVLLFMNCKSNIRSCFVRLEVLMGLIRLLPPLGLFW